MEPKLFFVHPDTLKKIGAEINRSNVQRSLDNKLEQFKQMDRLGVRFKEGDEVIAVLCREIADLRDKVSELSAHLPSTDQA